MPKPELGTVLVTGGSGFVGSALVPKLLAAGHRVRSYDRCLFGDDVLEPWRSNPGLEEIKGDLRDADLVARSLEGVDAVVHLACVSNDPSFDLDPVTGKAVNLDATLSLIDRARSQGVRRFVFASSSSVYGLREEPEITEDLKPEPLTGYSRYKLEAEEYLFGRGGQGFTVTALRPATVCGWARRLRLDLVVNIFATQAYYKKKITLFGGSQKRPNIHIEDIADCYVEFLRYPSDKIHRRAYNVGHGNHTLAELGAIVKEALADPAIEIVSIPTDDKRSYHISSERIRRELGYVASRPIGEAVRALAAAFRSGLVKDALDNPLYYNARALKERCPR
ncbi:MAG: GDP-L-fucose synthase [Candidatus Omnitrophica bacterium]|nr:GDP-L-fucose synthase [Candidatus Omnitrophota bacterium]